MKKSLLVILCVLLSLCLVLPASADIIDEPWEPEETVAEPETEAPASGEGSETAVDSGTPEKPSDAESEPSAVAFGILAVGAIVVAAAVLTWATIRKKKEGKS